MNPAVLEPTKNTKRTRNHGADLVGRYGASWNGIGIRSKHRQGRTKDKLRGGRRAERGWGKAPSEQPRHGKRGRERERVIQIMYPGIESTGGITMGWSAYYRRGNRAKANEATSGTRFKTGGFPTEQRTGSRMEKPDKICGRVASIREGKGDKVRRLVSRGLWWCR